LQIPAGEKKSIICLGGRGPFDDVTAAMLAQVLSVQAAETKVIDQERTQPSQLRKEDIAGATAIVLCVLDLDSARRAKFSLRRLRRLNPAARIGLALWQTAANETIFDRKKLQQESQADFLALNLLEATI